MKLKFKSQNFQTAAVNAVTDLFAGQERSRATFSVMDEGQLPDQTSFGPAELGVGNVLRLSADALTANMRTVQKRNLLPMTDTAASRQFCVEMETGTGKTYVYTKTIFELNRRYGFTKFIVVVPSVAIREGVYKSFQVTEEHFALQYDSVPCRYFIYNSAKLSDVRQFAASANIEVMIIQSQGSHRVTEFAVRAALLRHPPGEDQPALPPDPGGRLSNGASEADRRVLQPGVRGL